MVKGDYGIVVEVNEEMSSCLMAAKPRKEKAGMLGGWIGPPDGTRWLSCPFSVNKESAILDAAYFHVTESFDQIVLKTSAMLKEPPGIQVFKLPPKHQMPVHKVARKLVE